ncbi:sulfatase family protein [Aestuariivivens marinum]|uniref:sulfatase family protein n=1 Tax=Aestuariivivens marinum TaxID=2913555 RepID=UPI001F574CAC|nr:sulfatase [Aestuariivivens marinum]
MKKPAFVLGLLFMILCSCRGGVRENKPNIIIFFTDDQGYADVGVYGAEGFETPHLDALANDGIRFTDFYVPATVCTPSRVALLTGKYPKRVNMQEGVLSPYSTSGLDPNEYTLAELLKDNGYTTSCIGKWHLGHLEEFMPNNQGFDEFYGVPYSNDMDGYYYSHNSFQSPPLPFYRNTELVGEGIDQRLLTKRYTEEAVKQIKEQQKGQPFFMYLAHTMPHTPLHVSEQFSGKSTLGLYGDVIMELDWSMGEIVSALKEEGIYENTIIIFTSDNGPQIGSAKPLRGKKAQTWEGGQRVPGIMSWPKKIPKGTVSSEMVTTLDVFPTLAKVVGANIETLKGLDGDDISAFITRPNSVKLKERPFYYYARNGDLEAVRLGDWKLHISKSLGWNAKEDGEFQTALYNLKTDIGEQHNIAEKHPAIVDRLKQIMIVFDAELYNKAFKN